MPLEDSDAPERFPRAERWTRVLQDELGSGFWVIDEGLEASFRCIAGACRERGWGDCRRDPEEWLKPRATGRPSCVSPPMGRLRQFASDFEGAFENRACRPAKAAARCPPGRWAPAAGRRSGALPSGL